VYTPTLTGLGDRAHTAQATVSLGEHVQDIVALLEFEDLHDVILVGHSYSGMVITGVAAAVPGRVKSLVYCDAAIPEPGQSFFDAIAFPVQLPPGMTMLAPFTPQAFGVTDSAQIAFVSARLRPQSLATFLEPLSFNWEALANISKAYIHCTGEWFNKDAFLPFRAKALARNWTYFEVDSGHDVMITAPQELSLILLHLRR
jgi:pimeloyl-ACP methyl ester carboxylesterase